MDQLRALRYFVHVAESGSFTHAAKHFSVPASSISRRIADLEGLLGANLLQRSTRTVKLTEVGKEYYQQVNALLQRLAETDESVRNYQAEPMGRLRISSTVGFGDRFLLPLLDKFQVQYPKIILDVSLSDELSALSRDNIDIAIRGGYAPNERVIAVNLLDNQFFPVASPSYLAAHGRPKHPEDLKNHRGLFFRTPAGPTPWLAYIEDQWKEVGPAPALISNSGHWLLKKAIAGEGIIFLPRWVTADAVKKGQLEELQLSDPVKVTDQPNLGLYLLYQKHRYAIPKIRVAVDFIVESMKTRNA